MDDPPEGKAKMPKLAKVKNKMPAPVQITAEQLLREAKERELELVQPPPKQKVSDEAELAEYRLRKRKAFEDNIRKNRTVMINWIKYAAWEESQKEIQRCRSVYERSLDVDHRNITLWLKYAEMEMRNRQINHARNVWDRAITILPRANQFWYKYTYMEEMLNNVAGCRQVFERWMEWEPEEQAWHSYINFELRYKELDRARTIYERFVMVHPEVKNWIKYARFEDKHSYIQSSRRIFERAVEFFGEDNVDEKLLVAFAKFEESQKEHERARVIYKYALDHLDKEKCTEIYKNYTIHEKKFGDREGIEDVIVSKRKFQYEEEVKANPHSYDAWFDYLRLMESDGEVDQVRELYERAIANVPPSQEKRHWRRYIYLWINYALYEELETEDMEQCRQVYSACLDLIPHKKFTFAKIWLLFAQFEIRQKNLTKARKILGTAIGKCPKDKLFRGYIETEIQLREFERCRILYDKFLAFNPENCTTWMKYTELESLLGEIERSRAIFELAVNQPRLDMPEVMWKAFIDFEIEEQEYDKVRVLYRRLLQRTQHVKVWVSYAQFELSVGGEDAIVAARRVYQQANKELKSVSEKEERLMLLESWQEYENEYGDEESQASIQKLMPNKIKRRREVTNDDGSSAGWEEYYDYIFPDDEAAKPNLKLLAMAKNWKLKMAHIESEKDVDTAEQIEDSPQPDSSEKEPGEENNEEGGKSKWDDGEEETRRREGDSDSEPEPDAKNAKKAASESESESESKAKKEQKSKSSSDSDSDDTKKKHPKSASSSDSDSDSDTKRKKRSKSASSSVSDTGSDTRKKKRSKSASSSDSDTGSDTRKKKRSKSASSSDSDTGSDTRKKNRSKSTSSSDSDNKNIRSKKRKSNLDSREKSARAKSDSDSDSESDSDSDSKSRKKRSSRSRRKSRSRSRSRSSSSSSASDSDSRSKRKRQKRKDSD